MQAQTLQPARDAVLHQHQDILESETDWHANEIKTTVLLNKQISCYSARHETRFMLPYSLNGGACPGQVAALEVAALRRVHWVEIEAIAYAE